MPSSNLMKMTDEMRGVNPVDIVVQNGTTSGKRRLPKIASTQYNGDVAKFFDLYGQSTRRNDLYTHYFANYGASVSSKSRYVAVDFGCGTGWLTPTLSSLGFETVYGIDTSKDMLRKAIRLTSKELLENKSIIYSSKVPDIIVGKCDLVTAVHAHYHFNNLDDLCKNFFGKIASMLNDSGEAIIIAPPQGYIHKRLLDVENFIHKDKIPSHISLPNATPITKKGYISLKNLQKFFPEDGTEMLVMFDSLDGEQRISTNLTDRYWSNYTLTGAAQAVGLYLTKGQPVDISFEQSSEVVSVAMHFTKKQLSPFV